MMRKGVLKQYLTDKLVLILLLAVGSISWSLTMIKSGLIYSFGMGFWGANGHDGIWHVSLINSLAKGSFQMPIFAGSDIKNYHLGFDLVAAAIQKVTGIPTVNLYFQIIPPILALLVGLTAYFFVLTWTKSKRSAIWSAFFIYFGGSLAWIFGMGESTFWSQQSISTLINPPFALSLIFIFSGLSFLVKYQRERKLVALVLSVFFFGILLETKAYAGVLVLGSLFIAGFWQAFRERKYDFLKIFLGSAVVSLGLFLVLNKGSENLFIFQPFWFLQTLFNLDRFSIPRVQSAITNYNLDHNTAKLIPAYIFAFGIFWVGNMGVRLIKEIEVVGWLRHPRNINIMNLFIASIIVGGAFVPMLFVQQGTPWNTIQFFYYSLMFSAILAGVATAKITFNAKANKTRYLLSLLIILVTIPTTVITLKDVYLPARPPAKVSNEELEALGFLRSQPDGNVLTYPYDAVKAKEAENKPPRSLYLYESTAYVSAFSEKKVFLEDEVNLNITNFDWPGRRELVLNFLNTLQQEEARDFLRVNNIKYIYWVKPQRARLGETQLGLTKIFENELVDVFKVE